MDYLAIAMAILTKMMPRPLLLRPYKRVMRHFMRRSGDAAGEINGRGTAPRH